MRFRIALPGRARSPLDPEKDHPSIGRPALGFTPSATAGCARAPRTPDEAHPLGITLGRHLRMVRPGPGRTGTAHMGVAPPRAFTARRRSRRADNRSELNRVDRRARCLGTYGRRVYTGLLLGLEHLN